MRGGMGLMQGDASIQTLRQHLQHGTRGGFLIQHLPDPFRPAAAHPAITMEQGPDAITGHSENGAAEHAKPEP